jgi:hypothetical protein
VSGSAATTATVAAGDAGDDDVEDGDDAVDDGSQHGANAIDNSHQAVADGAEDGFELEFEEVSGWTLQVYVGVSFGEELTQETTAPILTELEWKIVVMV